MKKEPEKTSERSQSARRAVSCSPNTLERLSCDRSPWYETQEEIEAGLEWGRQKAELLHWVRRQMGRRLTRRERRCVELYFFGGKTYEEVGARTGTTPASAHRTVARALGRLREAVHQESLIMRPRKGPRGKAELPDGSKGRG